MGARVWVARPVFHSLWNSVQQIDFIQPHVPLCVLKVCRRVCIRWVSGMSQLAKCRKQVGMW